MPITVSGTSITFNDSTTQTTAFTGGGGVTSLNGQTGAVVDTSVNSIGCVMELAVYVQQYTAYYSNQTVSGSILYYSNAITQYNSAALCFNGSNNGNPSNQYTAPSSGGALGQVIQRAQSGNVGRQPPQGMTACSGTWRLMSPVAAGGTSGYDSCYNYTSNNYYCSLWVRVS